MVAVVSRWIGCRCGRRRRGDRGQGDGRDRCHPVVLAPGRKFRNGAAVGAARVRIEDIRREEFQEAERGALARLLRSMQERDLGANVRVRRRLSLPVPSSTRQSRAALPLPTAWTMLARTDVLHVHSFFGIGLEALLNGACLGYQ